MATPATETLPELVLVDCLLLPSSYYTVDRTLGIVINFTNNVRVGAHVALIEMNGSNFDVHSVITDASGSSVTVKPV